MNIRLDFNMNIMLLYNGRRSFYASFSIGDHRWWIQRWDSVRTQGPKYQRAFRSGKGEQEMSWSWGPGFAIYG